MLDLVKLTAQVTALSQHLSQEATASERRLQSALSTFQQVMAQPDLWRDRHTQWQTHLSFTAAAPAVDVRETVGSVASLTPLTGIHSVVATDGSQIVPSHHEIAYCSLINVGRVALHYHKPQWPVLDSVPFLFYRSADLTRLQGISVEELLSLRRTQAEVEELVDLALASRQGGPLLALVDGSLIHWSLEALPQEEQRQWLEPILAAYDRLREARIPIAGYVSASRSSEVVNYLRLGLCPYLGCDCQSYCPGVTQPPCNPFAPLSDRVFWSAVLEPGQRSSLWRSGAKVLQQYGRHHIYTCYLHVGEEVARVECPEWVAQDPELLNTMLEMILAQVEKGFGYPVALAEAHHLAVVRGGDRQRFFALIEQELIRKGLKNIAVSRKEARKRGGIA